MHTSLQLKKMKAQMINVTPINPLISSCEIKVLYAGENRNRSYISKPVAEKMAASLPNIPIVGEYLEYEQDFGDHGQEMVIDAKGVRTVRRTVPYGVVPTDSKIAWQMFLDDDGVEREYMVCQGYLWTGRYPECARVVQKGNGQSMELDLESIQGKWAQLEKEGDEYFIIDDAIFSALCILGENVEPCFEGASVTAPSVLYSLDKSKFTAEMTQFMLDLKKALSNEEGGEKMTVENKENITGENFEQNSGQNIENPVATEPNTNVGSEFEANKEDDKEKEEDFAKKDPKKEEDPKAAQNDPNKEDPKKADNGEDPKAAEKETPADETPKEDEKDKKKAKYNLEEVVEYSELLNKYTELENKYTALVGELEGVKPELHSLREMKSNIDRSEKNNMIGSFYMLDETDLADVKANMDKYTVEEIESKLSVIAVRKKVNFNLDDSNKSDNKTEEPIVSFNAQVTDNTPAWLKAVDNVVNKKSY